MDWRVRLVIDTMTRDLGKPLALAQMAGLVNLSTSRLAHLFRAEAGCGPAHYLRNLRLDHARRLLEETPLSVKEIMVRVGINDPSHFCRAFIQRHGASPRRLRGRMMWHRAVDRVRARHSTGTVAALRATANDK